MVAVAEPQNAASGGGGGGEGGGEGGGGDGSGASWESRAQSTRCSNNRATSATLVQWQWTVQEIGRCSECCRKGQAARHGKLAALLALEATNS